MSTSVDSSANADVLTHAVDFAQLGSTGLGGGAASLDALTDIPLTLTARLGQATLTIGDIMKLGPGGTIGLDREVTQPVDLVVGGKVFARGEVVVVNEKFAVRIKELASNRPANRGER